MNLLPIENFREQLHYNPYHFYGWANSKVPVKSTCNTVVKQYAYQTDDAVGRYEIQQAIETAEKRLKDYLGYAIALHYVTDDIRDYQRFYDKGLWARWPIDGEGHWKAIQLSEGYVSSVGVEKLTLIDTAPIAADSYGTPIFPYTGIVPPTPYLIYLDTDGDGLVDTFEVGVSTTVTNPSTIAVYLQTSDQLDSDMERWHILPVKVNISSGVATIRGRSWLLARPILYEGFIHANLDPDDVTNYAQALDVYERVCDPTGTTVGVSQGEFIWETLPYPIWWGIFGGTSLTSGDTDPAAQSYSVARVGVRNAQMGVVLPGEAIYDAVTGLWNATIPPWLSNLTRPPDRVLVRYRAGFPLDSDGQVAYKFRTHCFKDGDG